MSKDTKVSGKGDTDSAKADGVLRGTYLWCVWGAVVFAACAWLIVGSEDEPVDDASETEETQ